MRFGLNGTALVAAALGVGMGAASEAHAGCVDIGPAHQTWKIEQVPSASESKRAQEQIRKQIPDTHDKPIPNTASNESRAPKPEPC